MFNASIRIVVILAMVSTFGCASGPKADKEGWKFSDAFDLKKGMPWHKDDEPKPGMPTRLVDTWTDTVLHQKGEPSQRGFGGRIHFYDVEGGSPILVDGQLVVYGFDEQNRDPTDNRPTRRFVFPPEQLAQHMSESKIGPSYSVWLPWDAAGGEQKNISLICRFEPREGTLIVGDQSAQRLPGTMVASKPAPEQNLSSLGKFGVAQAAYNSDSSCENCEGTCNVTAGYEEPVTSPGAANNEPVQPRQQMTTTSISLPANFRKR
jgi:hypothetical protein